MRQNVRELLVSIGQQLPELVLYPALVGADDTVQPGGLAGGVASGAEASESATFVTSMTRSICRTLQEHNPRLVDQLQCFITELARITLLWEDQLSGALQALQVDVGNRVGRLREEEARVMANTKLPASEKARILKQKYVAIMTPPLRALEQQARELASPPATPHEENFWRHEGPGRALRSAIAQFRRPISSGFERCWEPFRNLQRDLNAFLRQPSLSLPLISPVLAALDGTQIPMPGLAADQPPATQPSSTSNERSPADGNTAVVASTADESGRVTLERFSPSMAVLLTKTKPKKLLLHGSDGREYNCALCLVLGRSPEHACRAATTCTCECTHAHTHAQHMHMHMCPC